MHAFRSGSVEAAERLLQWGTDPLSAALGKAPPGSRIPHADGNHGDNGNT